MWGILKLVLIFAVLSFIIAGVYSAECQLTSGFDSKSEKSYNYKVRILFENENYLNKPLLLYCDSTGNYPKPIVCRDKVCDSVCTYTIEGKNEIKVVERPKSKGLVCSELCSGELIVGEASIDRKSEGYRLMDSCPNGNVYIANGGNNSVSVVDSNTNKVKAVIPVGEDPRGVRCNPETGEVWVTNWGSGGFHVIDSETNTLINEEETKICLNPWGVDFFGENAFIACWGGKADDWCSEIVGSDANLAFNNLMSLSESASFNLESLGSTYVSALRNVNAQMIAPGSVVKVNTMSKMPKGSIRVTSTVNGGPWGSKKCGKYVFITNDGTDSVSVIEPETFKIVGTVKVGEVPWDAACDEINEKLYVANGGANDNDQKRFWNNRVGEASLSVIDVNSLKEEIRVPLGFGRDSEPWSVAVNQNNGMVYVVDMFDKKGSIHAISPEISSGKVSSFAMEASSFREWNGEFCRGITFVNGKVFVGCTGGGEKISTKGSLYNYESENNAEGSIVVLDGLSFNALAEINSIEKEGETIKLALKKGWNLASSLGKTEYNQIINKCMVGSAWSLSSEYKKTEMLNSLEGYWIFSKEECETDLLFAEKQSERMLNPGWNIISSEKSWEIIKNNCEKISNGIYAYDSERLRYILIGDNDIMNPLRGYFVKVENSCTIIG